MVALSYIIWTAIVINAVLAIYLLGGWLLLAVVDVTRRLWRLRKTAHQFKAAVDYVDLTTHRKGTDK
jgi:Flp pilus assembly protein TadB